MKVKIQDYNDVTVIEMQGELDSDASEIFEKNIADIISQNKSNIVLDMSGVGFIDSRGLSVLLWVRDYCVQNRRELRLAGLDENCKRILEITRLDSEFDLHSELAEAVKSFA
ncbi:MAG: STAS domain-containing protein [Sedimentisphaerales bacterium]|nr:STAS domain-containing protein [Sedimentisphaerales bacterium]